MPLSSHLGALTEGLAYARFRMARKGTQNLSEGQTCVLLDSMGMDVAVDAPSAGKVTSIGCKDGQPVREGDVLLRLE